MSSLTLEERYKSILAYCSFLCLATAQKDLPWLAPLYFAYDPKGVMYFISRKNSLHAEHIRKNPAVAVSVFNSTSLPGSADGLQIKATCRQLDDMADIAKAAIVLFTRRFSDEKERKSFFNPSLYMGLKDLRLFEITPEEIYIVDRDRPNDHRVRVQL